MLHVFSSCLPCAWFIPIVTLDCRYSYHGNYSPTCPLSVPSFLVYINPSVFPLLCQDLQISLCMLLWHPDWMLEDYIDFALQLNDFAFTVGVAEEESGTPPVAPTLVPCPIMAATPDPCPIMTTTPDFCPVMATTPEPCPVMAATPESPAVMAITPEFLCAPLQNVQPR